MRHNLILKAVRSTSILAVIVASTALPMGCDDAAPTSKEPAKEAPGISQANNAMLEHTKKPGAAATPAPTPAPAAK